MPRRTRREDPSAQRRRGKPGTRSPRVEDAAGPAWARVEGFVVVASNSDRGYLCPYCNRAVSGEPHIVAYPAGDLSNRRHYHSGCWAKKHRLQR